MPRHLFRLVKAAFAAALAPQRNRHNQIEFGEGKLMQVPGEVAAERKNLLVFQQMNQRAGDSGINGPTRGAVIGGGMLEAGRARILIDGQPLPAPGTTAGRIKRRDRSQAWPADRNAAGVADSISATSAGAGKKRRKSLCRCISKPGERDRLASPTAEGVTSAGRIATS